MASEATTGTVGRPSSRPYCSAALTASAQREPIASALFSTTTVCCRGRPASTRRSAGSGAPAST
ncbi:Uncharacterised protein [Mycobacteroides abscessus subsp. abscessus]|nr:Uncharacterised protein [Mycobacteroides abscessus subsp. abscessus]